MSNQTENKFGGPNALFALADQMDMEDNFPGHYARKIRLLAEQWGVDCADNGFLEEALAEANRLIVAKSE